MGSVLSERAKRWKRWFGIDLHGQREDEQRPYVVMLGVICMVLGMAMIVIGGYWWATS